MQRINDNKIVLKLPINDNNHQKLDIAQLKDKRGL